MHGAARPAPPKKRQKELRKCKCCGNSKAKQEDHYD